MNLERNVWYEMDVFKPPDGELLLVSNGGFMELIYIEDGITMKPWGYDSDDTPTLSVDKIKFWMLLSKPYMEIYENK